LRQQQRRSRHRNVVAVTVYVEFVSVLAPRCVERDARWLKFRSPHGDRYQAVIIDTRLDRAGRALQHEFLRMAAFTGEQTGNAAQAIAALLNFGAVCIEDAIGGHAGRIARGCNPHQLIESGPGFLVSESAQGVRRGCGRGAGALVDNEYPVTGAVHFSVSNVHRSFLLASIVYINTFTIER
jgi:hypothetical protein